MPSEWFSGKCGGPGVRFLDDGSFEIDEVGRPSKPINDAVKSFAPLIRQWSEEYGVPENLIAAIMMRESLGNQKIVSYDGGYGLMQLTNEALKEGHSNQELLDNASLNIQLGTKYIGRLWEKYGGNPIHVITSYNAGSPRCGGKSPNPWGLVNTQDYVGGVLALANGAIDSGVFRGSPSIRAAGMASVGGSKGFVILLLGVVGGFYAYPKVKKLMR